VPQLAFLRKKATIKEIAGSEGAWVNFIPIVFIRPGRTNREFHKPRTHIIIRAVEFRTTRYSVIHIKGAKADTTENSTV
jgi:hypothetical protein